MHCVHNELAGSSDVGLYVTGVGFGNYGNNK